MFKRSQKPKDARTPPGQALTERFPVLTYGPTPHIEAQNIRLRVWGKAEERSFTWDELMQMSQSTLTNDIHCVTQWSKLDVTWTGITIPEFLRHVTLSPEATHVLIHSYGGYTTNLPLSDFNKEENLLAHTLFDTPLPRDHGGPLRLVVPGLYFWKSAKWVNGFQFLDHDELGFWERNGYHERGNPWNEERFSD